MFSWTGILFVLFINLNATEQLLPEYLPGIPAYEMHPTVSSNITIAPTSCKNNSRLDCDGCHRQIICDYQGNILARVNCPSTRPYCSHESGQCISSPPKECSPFSDAIAVEKSDLCPSSGFFPHPLQCNKFNYCSSELQAIPYICPHLYVYDPVSHLCRLLRNPQECPLLNCYDFVNQFVGYPLDRSLYVFCNIDALGNVRPLLYQCASETVFSPSKQGCEFGCIEGEGKFEYPGDPTKYYMCLMTNYGQIVPFVMSCNDGSRFVNEKCKVEEKSSTSTDASTSKALHHAIAFVPVTVPMVKNN